MGNQVQVTAKWVRSRQIVEVTDAASVVGAIEVPAETLVRQVGFVITTAWNAATTVTLGDHTDSDGWLLATQNMVATIGAYWGTGGTAVWGNATGWGGKYYTSGDTIDASLGAGTGAGIGYVIAEFLELADVV